MKHTEILADLCDDNVARATSNKTLSVNFLEIPCNWLVDEVCCL